jgi:TRAP-type mannitol/chloroaromatic compound transport system permease small subunit
MDDSVINAYEIINEICLLLCGTVITSFTDFNYLAVDWIGWVYVGLTGLMIAYTIGSVFILAFKLIREKVSEKCSKKKVSKEPIEQ